MSIYINIQLQSCSQFNKIISNIHSTFRSLLSVSLAAKLIVNIVCGLVPGT